jgi:hypothetical protein
MIQSIRSRTAKEFLNCRRVNKREYPCRKGDASMHRDYHYRGYVINVAVETLATTVVSRKEEAKSGCAATVRVYVDGMTAPLIGPTRVTSQGGDLFGTEADALLAGNSAGQRAIDNLASSPQLAG